jgi:hypothetical protein
MAQSVQRIVWLGAGAAAVLIAGAAVVGWHDAVPPTPVAQSPVAAVVPSTPDAAAPATPATTTPAAKPATLPAAAMKPPSFDIVTVDPKGQAVVAGRATPGDRVRVLDGDRALGEVTADARGEWVLVPATPIAPGNRQLRLEATGPDGGPARRSDEVVALSVIRPTSGGGKPSALAVLLPGDANQQPRVLQEPAWSTGINKLLSLDTATFNAEHRLVLSGHAAPGSRVNIYADNRLLGTVAADAAGKWSLASAEPQPAGGFELWLDQLDANGSVASRIAAPFEPLTTAALAAGDSYVVERGNSLWVIAKRLYGQGMSYTAIYSANRDQIQNPALIYPGQHFKMPKS